MGISGPRQQPRFRNAPPPGNNQLLRTRLRQIESGEPAVDALLPAKSQKIPNGEFTNGLQAFPGVWPNDFRKALIKLDGWL